MKQHRTNMKRRNIITIELNRQIILALEQVKSYTYLGTIIIIEDNGDEDENMTDAMLAKEAKRQ